jgi:hypothetical protein
MEGVMATVRDRRSLGPARLLFLGLLLTIPLVACDDGGECDTCASDEDCQADLVCSSFSDGSRRCGSGIGASSCRVR